MHTQANPPRRIIIAVVTALLFVLVVSWLTYVWVIINPVAPVTTDAALLSNQPPDFMSWLLGSTDSEGVLQGDFGQSLVTRDRDIRTLFAERLPASTELILISGLMATIWGIALGMLTAYLKLRAGMDGIIRPILIANLALPAFCIALIGIYHLALQARMLPLASRCTLSISADGCAPVFERIEYLILPVASLAIIAGNALALWIRQAIIRFSAENEQSGANSNAFPLGMIWGYLQVLPFLFVLLASGLVIVEGVFAWPGVGRLWMNSIVQRDPGVAVALVMWVITNTAFLFLVTRILNTLLLALTKRREPDYSITAHFLMAYPSQPTTDQATQTPAPSTLRILSTIFAGLALITLTFMLFTAFTSTADPLTTSLQNRFLAPSVEHPYGTDELGRDLYARVQTAIRTTMTIGLHAGIIATVIGGIIGLILAIIPDRAGQLINGIVNAILTLIFLLPAVIFVGHWWSLSATPGIQYIPLIITLPIALVIVRASVWKYQALTQKQKRKPTDKSDFAENQESIPVPHKTNPALHALATLAYSIIFIAIVAITIESTLSFLGTGIQPPMASLGSILASSMNYFQQAPYIILNTTMIIFGLMLSLWIIAEYLRNRLHLDT